MFPRLSKCLLLLAGVSFSLGNLVAIIGGSKTESLEGRPNAEDVSTASFLNFGRKRNETQHRWYEHSENANRILRNKADMLSRLLKIHIDRLRNQTEQVELVFVVDASGSVGQQNFRSELSFVRKLLSDFTVEPSTTRVGVVTFGGRRNVNRNVDQISRGGKNNHKCYLLNKQLTNISYSGGGTYTRGALLEALAILEKGQAAAKKVVFLITDGFSNGGDPRPAANLLKSAGAAVFTFGIRTGNVEELHDIASSPGYTHSYLLDSFSEFEALARRALHRDLKTGHYAPVNSSSDCDDLCANANGNNGGKCCDELATCGCGTATGHYACICPTGYFGSGFKGSCQPCPNGTYASKTVSGDFTSSCVPCPDINHVTIKTPATSVEDCTCAFGFVTDENNCEVITCPKLRVPENGYLVKASACNNVVNAACGIRCRIGFHLTGDSIRLCGKTGSWSGNEPQCLLKTCPALRAPAHGQMHCQHDENYQHRSEEDSATYPIDTRCQFKCDTGYQLRGSKVRNCLPVSRWDGLKVTCKAIKCDPLSEIANGDVSPDDCIGPEKVPFGTNCTITCKKGFSLEGPRNRVCSGRTGVWSQRHIVDRCVDKIPPIITCPSDVTAENVAGKNYGIINEAEPIVIENTDMPVTIWTKPHIVFPWKMKIGIRTVIFVAQDASRNKAKCKFKVKVFDTEPPHVENCIDPPTFYTDLATGVNNITWEEPTFYDNSKGPVQVTQNRRTEENAFSIGTTRVVYNATDKYGNLAICVLNITVKDVCQNLSAPLHGAMNCSSTDSDETRCIVTCEEGYGFGFAGSNFNEIDSGLLLKCNSNSHDWNDNFIPDCTESDVPKTIVQEGTILLQGNTTELCDNVTIIQKLSSFIAEDVKSKLDDVCENDIECNLVNFNAECNDKINEEDSTDDNLIRRRRSERSDKTMQHMERSKIKAKRRREKIEVKFKFVGKVIRENFNSPKQGLQKIRQWFQAMTHSGRLDLLNNKTNYEIAKLALNLHLMFKDPQEICDAGSILRKHSCVKCPLGTFHNMSLAQCRPCPFGDYQNVVGSLECEHCPEYTSTKRIRAKSLQDCISVCRPGHYSHRKRYNGSPLSLEPCSMCNIGFYQPRYGQSQCLPCPTNKTTKNYGSTDIGDCRYAEIFRDHICDENPCLNGGTCVQEDNYFSCECHDYYVGSRCDKFQNPCDSMPCLNGGICSTQNKTIKNKSDTDLLYVCTCKDQYTGSNCQIYVDECHRNPCQNGGKCTSTEDDYECECKDGFEGEFCEIYVDHCELSPCEEGSTCRTINKTWKCFCRSGFLGTHCNLLPCDWLPCHRNSICVNIEEENATRQSYRCDCPDGYTGEDCVTKIDYCESLPCQNDGRCISSLFDYTCVCPIPFSGSNCEIELSSDYVMHFPKSGTTDYVIMKSAMNDFSELTVCLWLQSVDTFNYGTVLSYATHYHDNTLTLTDYNGLVLYVNGQRIVTDIKVNDGHWHFLCITWESEHGGWNIFIDGILRDNGTYLSKGKAIQGNGSLVIGQEQDRVGGAFSESESFIGKLTLLDVWDTILDEQNITYFLTACNRYYGSVFAWAQMRENVHGDVVILNSPFCRGCPLPIVPFKGHVNTSKDLMEVTYYCDAGYVMRFGGDENRMLRRKCLKQGQWEGYYTPTCTRIKCGFPGYFPRGHIQGWSYFYGDEIYYYCTDGYELRGNPRRVCTSTGKWSGQLPICIGVTCKNLLAPENGDIEYIVEEHERDDITIMQAGQQLEFKCNSGYRLIGEKFLTCLESGVWDHDRPICASYGCPPPENIEHSYIASAVFENQSKIIDLEESTRNESFTKSYSFGDIIGLSCKPGYKFQNNHDLLIEIKLQCSTNGAWLGVVPNCVPLSCPRPNLVKDAAVFLKMQNGTIVKISDERENQTIRNLDDLSEETDAVGEKNESKAMEYFDHLMEEDLSPGSQIFTVCHRAFEIVGDSVRICTDKGLWSADAPLCRSRTCSFEEHPMFAILNTIDNGNVTNVMLSRNVSHKWVGNEKRTHTYESDFWELLMEGNAYGDQFIFRCKNQSKIGQRTLNESIQNFTWTCNESGKWEIQNLLLENDHNFDDLLSGNISDICGGAECVLLNVPEHGYIDTKVNINDSHGLNMNVIHIKCHSGYILEGNGAVTCFSNGTWSTIPFCKPVTCDNPPLPMKATIKQSDTKSDYTVGSIVTYQCSPGYRIFGKANARCLANGKWSKTLNKCSKISCGKPKTPPGISVQGRSYLFEDKLIYVCPGGKRQGYITCQANGQWSSSPSCHDS